MSTIKLQIEVDSANVGHVTEFLSKVANGTSCPKEIKVVDAEEVKPEAPAESPKTRPSRAKTKPAPEPIEEPEEEETFNDEPEEEEDTTDIDIDDIRAMQAKKVDKHRETIKGQLKEMGATGISSLDEKHYSAYFDFLAKLK